MEGNKDDTMAQMMKLAGLDNEDLQRVQLTCGNNVIPMVCPIKHFSDAHIMVTNCQQQCQVAEQDQVVIEVIKHTGITMFLHGEPNQSLEQGLLDADFPSSLVLQFKACINGRMIPMQTRFGSGSFR